MEEAVLADRVIVLNEGKIEFDNCPKKVFSNVETLRKLGLSVPQVTELAYLLKKDGIEIPSDILTNDEMIEFLERNLK
jgi:cobalt import ATP-binding protein cbiO 2